MVKPALETAVSHFIHSFTQNLFITSGVLALTVDDGNPKKINKNWRNKVPTPTELAWVGTIKSKQVN